MNIQQTEDAQKRIKQAMQQLRLDNDLPEEIFARLKAIQRVISISTKTLYKHLHLWHPDHIEESKTADETGVSADKSPHLEPSPRSPRSASNGELLHHREKYEGCGTEKDSLSKNLIQWGSLRGFSTGFEGAE
ncbi:MAG: hypothetical protein ACFE0J_22235 [Elainellaceae cyanobacterium]